MHTFAKKNTAIDMTEGPLFKKILLFSIPLMASSLLQLLYNAADIIIVGRFVGEGALAAVGATSALIALIINFFIGLSTGASVCVSNAIGARNDKKGQRFVHTSMALSIAGGVAAMIVGIFIAKPILVLMKTPGSILNDAVLYTQIYFLGVPASLIFNFAAGLLRASGDTKRPLYILSLSGLLNVALNVFFVVVCHMGVAGVAISTSVSQYLSTFLIILHMMKLDSNLKYTVRNTKFHKKELLDIVRIGVPSGLTSVMFNISNMIIQSSINLFGDIVIAGNTAANNIESFIYTAMNTLYQASQTFAGQNYGAGKIKRINKVLSNSLIIVFGIGLGMGVLALTFRYPLLNLYAPGQEAVIDAGINRMMVICTTYYLCGIMDVVGGCLRGMRYSFSSMIISMIGACIFRIVWLSTVFQAEKTTFNIYISYPISWAITTLAYLVCYFIAMKRVKSRMVIKE